jgi:ribonuclease HI
MARRAIWTDGCCLRNPGGAGGWAAILVDRERTLELSGGDPSTTNNRMELMAVIEALRRVGADAKPVVWSDSEYVVKGATVWIHGWRSRGWCKRTPSGSPGAAVKNADLWQALDAERQRTDAELRWLRGHAGDPLNERADALSLAAAAGAFEAEPQGGERDSAPTHTMKR